MSWSRSRSTGPIPTGCRTSSSSPRATSSRVPLGAREATAVVWAENPKPNPRLDNRLKDVEQKLELPPLKPELRSFVDWVANYTVSSRGMVLRMCLRMGEHLGAERERVGVRLAGPPPQRMTPARQRVLELLRRRHGARQERSRARSRRQRRRDRRADRRRHAGNRGAAAGAGRAKSPIRISRSPNSPPTRAPPPRR